MYDTNSGGDKAGCDGKVGGVKISESGTKNNRHHELCRPGCQPAIREFVKENDVIAVYESGTKTFYWRPFNDIKLKGSVLQTVEDKDGKSVSWRYWQNDKGYWKRAIYKEKK